MHGPMYIKKETGSVSITYYWGAFP